MIVPGDLATLRSTLIEDGWLEHPDSPLAALDRVEAEINEMRRLIQAEHAAKAAIGGGPCVCKFCRT